MRRVVTLVCRSNSVITGPGVWPVEWVAVQRFAVQHELACPWV
jgi:hypothetical protein